MEETTKNNSTKTTREEKERRELEARRKALAIDAMKAYTETQVKILESLAIRFGNCTPGIFDSIYAPDLNKVRDSIFILLSYTI